MDASWIIGSVKALESSMTINGAPNPIRGSLYLWHPTAALSLLDEIVAAMLASGCVNPAAVLTQDRRVKLSADAPFTVTWTDTALRDLLGFSGDLAAAATYIAPGVPRILWSPGKRLTSELSPHGTAGNRRPLAYFSMSPSDGTAFVVSHGTRTDQRWSVNHVPVDRIQRPTATAGGGEWSVYFDACAARGFLWYLYPDVIEIAGSTAAATLIGGLGPYVLTPDGRAPTWSYRRSAGFTWCDKRADLEFSARVAAQYPT